MEIVINGDGQLHHSGVPVQSGSQSAWDTRLMNLSSWLMILGTVRLLCALGDQLDALFQLLGPSGLTPPVLSRYLQEHPPALLLVMGWPLFLGWILRRTGNSVFVKAAWATLLILSVGGAVTLIFEAFLRADYELSFGSFHVSRWSLRALRPAAVFRAAFGIAQLALELKTAWLAWDLVRSKRPTTAGAEGRPHQTRRNLQGRLALYMTLAFMVLSCREAAWSTYLTVLNKSDLFRQFVLSNDRFKTSVPSSEIISFVPNRASISVEGLLNQASMLAERGQYAEARDGYLRVIKQIEAGKVEGVVSEGAKDTLARALNNLGWLLATCEDARFVMPAESVAFTRKALNLVPEQGTYWNTLGVAYYRARDWEKATEALNRSMELRDGTGDAYDWYFLAMLQAQRGHKDDGLSLYQRAVAWSHADGNGTRELYRFQVEAASMLGLEKPAPPQTISRPTDDLIRVPRKSVSKRMVLGRRALSD